MSDDGTTPSAQAFLRQEKKSKKEGKWLSSHMQLSGQNLERRWEEKLTRKREGKVFTPTSSHGRKVSTKPTIEEMLPNSQKIGDIYLKKKDNVR